MQLQACHYIFICYPFLAELLISTSALLPLCFFPRRSHSEIIANCGSPGLQLPLFSVQVHLRWTFLAVRGHEEGGGMACRRARKWISVPISSRARIPGGFSNTMFYKLMVLEVGQGYPQPPRERERHNSSVSPKGSDPKGCTALISPGLSRNIHNLTEHYAALLSIRCHSHFCEASGTFFWVIITISSLLKPQ